VWDATELLNCEQLSPRPRNGTRSTLRADDDERRAENDRRPAAAARNQRPRFARLTRKIILLMR
jgi:hypothetical protein